MTAASLFMMAALIGGIFTLIPFAVWTNISYAQLFQPGAAQDSLLMNI
ncbi:MAG TPA: hypothetical protein VFJ51_07370 [Nitrososphaeraceae archaeon]|nr:hypothetical protein [Nitrososphaeraceae archaeon]